MSFLRRINIIKLNFSNRTWHCVWNYHTGGAGKSLVWGRLLCYNPGAAGGSTSREQNVNCQSNCSFTTTHFCQFSKLEGSTDEPSPKSPCSLVAIGAYTTRNCQPVAVWLPADFGQLRLIPPKGATGTGGTEARTKWGQNGSRRWVGIDGWDFGLSSI